MSKLLTYLTILALAISPVKLLSANAENINIQKSMSQSIQIAYKCQREMMNAAELQQESKQSSKDSTCCNESAQDCPSCNHCPQATSAVFLPVMNSSKFIFAKSHHDIICDVLLNDSVIQENPLRPPRSSI